MYNRTVAILRAMMNKVFPFNDTIDTFWEDIVEGALKLQPQCNVYSASLKWLGSC